METKTTNSPVQAFIHIMKSNGNAEQRLGSRNLPVKLKSRYV